ncbi:type VI secretion system baseplate subunit TssE [Paracoccus lutimaris]|uniref:Type VI secretion system protein ImpF n=1 Tax=Paracoccus lutimaris TaxID=1490030 RepID=A0A368ZBP2_9RHOB|nr:type VI secretion system baseplate subunit TssE [Paracoccus lutimaris]RCW88617.1 type VI secretion system protein ImpF [Paracoccus lutimaris]
MIDRTDTPQAIREALQPSLWDRLVDELHDLGAEAAALRRELGKLLDNEQAVETLLAGGAQAIAAESRLDDDARLRAHRLGRILQRQSRLKEGGVVVTSEVLREAVRRDIEMLFNTERLEVAYLLSEHEMLSTQSPDDLLRDYPEIRRSVLNYGVPPFSGRRGSDFDTEALARELKEVLAIFEPRLRRDSIRVTVNTGEATGLRVEIDALLMLTPVPERLRLSTLIDLDNGRATTRMEDR